MKKAFTLAESLITMAIIGIIMALSIPAVIQSTNDTAPLFKKAYGTVEEITNELVNDVSLYPTGELSDTTFCNNFFSKMNTIGYTAANCANTFVAAIPGTPNVTSSNAMRWYNVDEDFTAAQCDGAAGGGGLTGIDSTTNTCIRISVDVNGANKGANTNAAQSNRDIFTIYITKTGKVTVQSSTANTYNEASILQN